MEAWRARLMGRRASAISRTTNGAHPGNRKRATRRAPCPTPTGDRPVGAGR